MYMPDKKNTEWPADKVERRSVESLVPYIRNARTHSAEQIDQIAASIKEWGWTVPVLIDEEGGIIAGHCRVLAARKLGIADVPVMTATGWSEARKAAYVLADNKLALNAGWDADILRVEIGDLQQTGFDLELTGFSIGEIADLFGEAAPEGDGAAGQPGAGSLAAKFMVPPFSVLNAREGWWQDRKRAWLALGIQSELGRGAPIGGAPMPLDRETRGGAYVGQPPRHHGTGAKSLSQKASPSGSPRPAMKLRDDKAVCGDGRGREIAGTDPS